MTRRKLEPGQPLLVGRLFVRGRGLRSSLGLEVWCPYCKTSHVHGWDDPPFRSDLVSHREAHCTPGSPLYDRGYHVGLDPSHHAHNRATLDRLLNLLVAGSAPKDGKDG